MCPILFISRTQESVLTNVMVETQISVGVKLQFRVRHFIISGMATLFRLLVKPNMLLAKLTRCTGVREEISD